MKCSTYSLGELVKIKYGKNQKHVVSDDGQIPIYGTGGIMGYATESLYDKPSILIGRKGTIGKVKYADHPFWTVDTLFYTEVNEEIVLPKFLFYLMSLLDLNVYNEGTTIPSLRTETLNRLEFSIPPLPIQRKIAAILSALDDKIETNNAICRNLEEQAMALFKRRFFATSVQQVEDKPVYDFAEYVNGAAFKQHEYGEMGLPIIKIAELKSGISSSTLLYSGSDKEEKFYIQNGDILFSWSGNPETSIDVFIWTQGEAILNQHIFNVKSRYGAKWFTYLMLRSYMPVFAKIAADKQTTGLGHVTVADLKRLTFPFNLNQILEFEKEASFYMELAYNNKVMNNYLSNLRASLLPKLVSGELSVENIN